jgi:hypothetical protein
MRRRWWPGLVVVTATPSHRCLSIDADHWARAGQRERAEAALQVEQADADDRREDHQAKKIDHRWVLLFNRTASTDSKPESSAGRSRDRGHHPPSTQPVVGAFGFNRGRTRGPSVERARDDGRGTYLTSGMVGADAMSVLPSPGSAPPDLGLSSRTTRT